MNLCPDCGQPMLDSAPSAGPAPPSGPEPAAMGPTASLPATGAVGPRAHWLDCTSPAAFRRRVRSGVEPGYVPITFGRIKRWKECAWGEQQENRIADRVRSQTEQADIGTAVHKVLEADARGLTVELDALAKLLPVGSRADYEWFLRSARKFTTEETRPHALFLEDDARFWWEFPVTLEDGSMVIAQVETKMDRLAIFPDERLAEVVDYKTGRLVEKSVDEDPQGMLYCAVVTEQELGQDLEFFDFIQPQLRFWQDGPSVRWTRGEIEDFKIQFRNDVEAYVRESEFRTRPGRHCHWCSVAFRCPQGKKLLAHKVSGISIKVVETKREEKIVTTSSDAEIIEVAGPVQVSNDEQARELALTAIQMKAAINQIDSWLREWVKQTGKNIDLGDGTDYGNQIKSSLKLPPGKYDEARKILIDNGFNFDDYVRWDMSEGEGWKFIKGKRGPMAGLLTALAEPEAYGRWEQSKKEAKA